MPSFAESSEERSLSAVVLKESVRKPIKGRKDIKMESTEMDVKKIVKEKYGQAAAQARSGVRSCCGPAAFSCCSVDPITKDLYT